MCNLIRSFVIALLILGMGTHHLNADVTPDQVLVVVNDSSQLSIDIGNYYAQVRSLPAENVLHLAPGTSSVETISRSSYNTEIRDPLINYLTVSFPELQDRIHYIVLTKGVPHRINNSGGSGIGQSAASVSSELCLLFTGLVPDNGQPGRISNPFYDIPAPFDSFRAEHQGSPSISYLVFRLDGYQTNPDPNTGVPEDIKRLIDDAQAPTDNGLYVLDATSSGGQGNDWMNEANSILTDMGKSVSYDTDPGIFLKNQVDVLAYCSWGSNDPSDPGPPYYGEIPVGSGNVYPGNFLPGSLASTYVSTSARTFIDGNQNYGQSLIADLIHLGVTATNGHVFEPFLDAVSQPDIVFRSYSEGCSVGDAFYQSIAYLSWENTIVCDPLMKKPTLSGLAPSITSVAPGKGSYQGGTLIQVHGENFRTSFDTQVLLDGILLDHVTFHDRTRLSFTMPPHDPGPVELRVETPFGAAIRTDGILYTPALTSVGTPGLGLPITIGIVGEIADSYILFLGLDSGSFPLPPFGKLEIDPGAGFFLIASGFMLFGREDISGTIPNDPILAGVDLYFQGLIGRDIGARLAYFSNLLIVSIP